ncbi:hypothetical protein FEM48_Zijuj04G0074300 [Ziziphus jujuba var. spinosa]|uniref:H/ACA ribonucleoprotein complex non-core subunit NAF1 n=1 Tax=Ziziphus jujuba var. spinosa TaxID=714518 RepID=A0A978VIK5_ZIZJJ|nr:hypothetical protein FEM48_Zijuj04G0074300 [Ziziphus jujuba var. spinosa]
MVGFISEPSDLEDDQAPKLKNLSDPLDLIDPRSNDFSLADSFLDFDSIRNWFEDIANQEMADGESIKMEAIEEQTCRDTSVEDQIVNGSKPILDGSAPIDVGSGSVVKMDKGDCEMPGNFSCSIAEEIGKVSLVSGSESSVLVGETGMENGTRNEDSVKSGTVSDKDESESSESESASTSSSSSSTSSSSDDQDDDVEGKEEEDDLGVKQGFERDSNGAGEVEEGEIRDADGQGMAGMVEDDDNESDDNDDMEAMVVWSDTDINDGEDEEGDGGGVGGPIRSKNELKVLPLVPPVDVTLLPHHQMIPVGSVLSIVGTQVIVEGVEKHNPLNDGSILWITDSRTPLGLVDEIFGPVKNPYYVVRYNSESEVPSGIRGGTSISFVPEFASHVLNSKDIYKKGYDASGANDEEVSDDGEFSDDEKEAEYKRMQKMTKRGKEEKVVNNKSNRRKGKSRVDPWKNEQPSTKQTPSNVGHQSSNQQQHHFSPVPTMIDHGNCAPPFAVGQGVVGGTGLVPPFPPTAQTVCSSGVWTNGMPFQPTMQPQTPFFPNGIPINSMPWLLQNNQYPQQMPMPNRMPFNQQADPNQMLHSAAVSPGDQPNNFSGSTYVQGLVGQNNFNQSTFGMGLQGHPSQQTLNAVQQGILSNGLHMDSNYINNMPQSMVIPGNVEVPQQFNVGASSSRGRRLFRRGGGRFVGGRGR